MNDDLKDVERQIRAWTARPPANSPQVARTRVLVRLEKRRSAIDRWITHSVGPGRVGIVAAIVLILGLASGLLLHRPTIAPPPSSVPSTEAPAQRLLVYELESGTKLYLALATQSTSAH